MKRQDERQQEWWSEALSEVRGRLSRIDRGESWAPAQVVRVLRAFVAPEVQR